MTELELLEKTLGSFAGITAKDFATSLPHWQLREYKKGEFYNEYKNVCKHLGFIISGVFRTYHVNTETGEEKNLLFFSEKQFVASYKSFLTQTPCNYYTESLVDSSILYIHIDDLNRLYSESHQWERFGRFIAELAFNEVMDHTEDMMFKTPEQRYQQMLERHPGIFNSVPLYHIASYLGIQGPSLSRIRKRLSGK